MAAIPAAAAAAYQSIANIGAGTNTAAGLSAGNINGAGSFTDFLSGALKDSVSTMKTGEQMATQQIAGNANIVDVVNAVNSAELTLDTVVAVRDKVVQAYQAIMNMPI
ncbi:MAG TPA: flagellar hook-basal body complex protein FliE [Rhizomicrobium sp.]|jgi:flagellar hook-basal body complex protein FliE|nr:flagellar hook-basal body complex protein FliE [Rhizomicrobium sp.]